MIVIHSVPELQTWSRAQRAAGKKIGLVPTMGFLHDGHASLMDCAKQNGADVLIVSVFVNPTQFGPNEDFDKYPRDLEHDKAVCEAHGTDVVFAPAVSDMYKDQLTCWVYEDTLSKGLCGLTRPIHFRGVTTVVAKLFNAALPDLAVFGRKDAQQAAVIKRMVRDLNFPLEIIVAPIVREKDGLAMSSRNKYLSADDRKNALGISRALFGVRDALSGTAAPDWTAAKKTVRDQIAAAGGDVEYVEVLETETMLPIEKYPDAKNATVAIAARFGKTRLIDNVQIPFA